MDTAAVLRGSFPRGVAASIGIHLLIVAYIVISFSHPQPLQAPSDLSNAIPISLEMFRPTPPPEPPRPEVEPEAPRDVVTTTAPEPEAVIEEAPAEPSPPTPPSPPAEPSVGTPSPPTYASIVAGILERNKHYPTQAWQSGITGVVEAFFVVNHQGHVIGYRIEKGSGQAILDQEVVRLLKHVKFPPIPDDGGDPQRREFRLPIVFRIERPG